MDSGSFVDPVKYENVDEASEDRDILREDELVIGILSTSNVGSRLGTALGCVLFKSKEGSDCALW